MIRQKVLVCVYRLVLGGGPEYLLLRRYPGRGSVWQPVTGGAKERETLLAAATREVGEETGIGAPGAPYKQGGGRKMPARLHPLGLAYGFEARGKRFEETVFARCAPEDAPIALSDEHCHGRWFRFDQAVARLTWEGPLGAVTLLHQRLSEVYAGVDPSPEAPQGPAVALLDGSGRLIAWATLAEDLMLGRWLPSTTALAAFDAPLTLPFGVGRCCLEEPATCGCRASRPPRGRLADRQLLRQGIARLLDPAGGGYRKAWIERALSLADLLRRRRTPLVEVCGLAARRRLLDEGHGDELPRGRLELQRALARLVPGMPQPHETILTTSELGAVLAAHTAWLHARRRTEPIGDAAEGAIVVPEERSRVEG